MEMPINNDTESISFERKLSLGVAISLLFISFASTIANALLLSAIYNDPYKCFRSPPIYFITNLALADLATGLIVNPLYAIYDIGVYQDKEYTTVITIGDHASYITVNNAVCTIVSLAIDRCVAIKKPFFYRRLMTGKTVAFIVASIWIYSLFFSALRLMGMSNVPYVMLDTHLHVTFAFLALTCLFAFIYQNLKQEKRNTNLRAIVSDKETQQKLSEVKSDKRLVVTIFLILLAFFLCFTPYAIFVHLLFFCDRCKTSKVYYLLSKLSEPIAFINSVLNPFIYAWRHENFRKAFIWVARCRGRPSKLRQSQESKTTGSKGTDNTVELEIV